jgi:hypothetical protein
MRSLTILEIKADSASISQLLPYLEVSSLKYLWKLRWYTMINNLREERGKIRRVGLGCEVVGRDRSLADSEVVKR